MRHAGGQSVQTGWLAARLFPVVTSEGLPNNHIVPWLLVIFAGQCGSEKEPVCEAAAEELADCGAESGRHNRWGSSDVCLAAAVLV